MAPRNEIRRRRSPEGWLILLAFPVVAALGLMMLVASAAPAATNAYVTDLVDGDVSVISTATNNKIVGDIPVGESPAAIAVTPDGSRAYVANLSDGDVSVINTTTNTKSGPDIAVAPASLGRAIAFSADGTRAYVTNDFDGDVSVINTATNTKIGPDIPVGNSPWGVAIYGVMYVANVDDDDVSVINPATGGKVRDDIGVGDRPIAIAITPDGKRAYVTNSGDDDVSVINNGVPLGKIGPDIAVGDHPLAIAITPDGTRAYVANADDGDLSVINTATNTKIGPDIPVGSSPSAIAIADAPIASASASAKPQQRAKKISVKLLCPGRLCTATVKGRATVPTTVAKRSGGAANKKRFALKRKVISLDPNESKKVRVKFKNNGRSVKRITKLLKRGATATARLTVKLSDDLGPGETEKLRVKLKR